MNEFLLNHEMKIHQSVSETWVEIDNREDYERAKKLFGDKSMIMRRQNLHKCLRNGRLYLIIISNRYLYK